jgi:type VI secretion system protein ImpG
LVESFAYLTARIQHKLDDDIPELSDALLGVLFPHYLNPIPSMSIAQFVPDKEQLESTYTVPKGTQLATEQFQGDPCIFTTAYPTELNPFELKHAQLLGLPFSTPGSSRVRGAQSVLKLAFETFTDQVTFTQLKTKRLRFYLKGQSQHINPLYQMLLNECVNVAVVRSESDTSPQFMGANAIEPVGFSLDEGLLPYPPASFTGYRLLTEHFVFPEKFMFVDIPRLDEFLPPGAGTTLELYIYLKTTDVELEHNINAQTFVLGCSPVVNLFPQRADPITLDQTRHEYLIVPEARRSTGREIYSVDKVSASTPGGEVIRYAPLYGMNHDNSDIDNDTFWVASRRGAKLDNFLRDEGTNVYLSLVDINLNPNLPDLRVLNIDTTCSNRDLPTKLPYTADQPKLEILGEAPPCTNIRFLRKPTAVVRPPLRNFARWRLISHLNLNFLSLTGRGEETEALKEILRLYDFRGLSITRALIDSIVLVKARPISAPLNIDGHATMCRGMEVEVEIDDLKLAGSSVYLFATVLEHFFALYCSINSFTRVLVRTRSKEGYLKKCPPRVGERVLL